MGTTNTLDLNNRIDKLEKAVSGGDSAQANKTDIATEFSATTNYTAGCFVYYGGKLYQFNADHSAGAWDPTDVAEANVTSGLTNLGSATDLGNVQGSDTITLSNAVSNYRFIQICIGYYASGYPCFGQALLPVSTLYIGPDNIATSIAFSGENINGRVDISFLSATSVKVVNTSGTLYTKVVGIA